MKKRNILYIAGIIANPLFVLLCFASLLSFGENKGIFQDTNFLIMLKTNLLLYLLLVLLTLAFYALFNNIWNAYCIVTLCLFLFYVISYYKLKLTGMPLRPADVVFISSIKDILSFVPLEFDEKIIFCLLFIGLALAGMYFCLQPFKKQLKLRNTKRFWVFIYATAIIIACFFSPIGKYTIIRFLNLSTDNMLNQNLLYSKYGDLMSFYLSTDNKERKYIDVKSSEDTQTGVSYSINKDQLEKQYSSKLMEQVLKQVEDSIAIPSNHYTNVEKPNVVVILSEAFWDPTRLESFTFSQEPIPNYKELSKTNISGNILTPVIGGVTCNVEYEFLVGSSIRFVDEVDVPFESQDKYIPDTDERAIPWQFKKNDYKTIAVHPFNKFFYNRSKIYPKLGFDEFISLSEMDNPPIKGEYVSDEYFMQTVIKTIDKTEEPLFLFGISMENHYPYNAGKFKSNNIKTQSSHDNNSSTSVLDSYAQGVYDADKSLKQLIDYLNTQQEPTLVFFFGDHLPLIDVNPMNFYNKAGYTSSFKVGDWNLEDVSKMYSTPYLLWANYELPKVQLSDFSPIYIGPILMDLANLNKNIYTSYLIEMQKHVPVLHRDIYIDEDGVKYKEPPIEDKPWIDNFFYIQYDSLKYPNHNGMQFITNKISQYSN